MRKLPIYEDRETDAAASCCGTRSEGQAGAEVSPRRRYWLSLDAYSDAPGYRERAVNEFAEGAHVLPRAAVSRRQFMQLLGASAMLAGTSGCDLLRRPEKKVVPYARRPEEILPGTPNMYASAFPFGAHAIGVVVRSNEGRPTKIEGNPDHPASGGSTNAYAQAAILEIYDPDRSRRFRTREGEGWKDADEKAFTAWLRKRFRTEVMRDGGAGLRVLAGPDGSPSMQRMRAQLLERYPNARWVSWEPVGREALHAGAKLAFGKPYDVLLQLENADRVLALDSDFLASEGGAVRNLKAFSSRRHVHDEARETNRLYVVEPHFTATSTLADHRLRLKPSEIGTFLQAVAGVLLEGGLSIAGLDPELAKRLRAAANTKYPRDWHRAVAKDLLAHRGRSAIVVGMRQPAWVHALALSLNTALGNVGATMQLVPPADPEAAHASEALAQLVDDMRGGKVHTLLVLEQNPVYAAPVDLGFGAGLEKVEAVVHLGLYEDETAAKAHWHVPAAHWLESWGDGRGIDGTVALRQPLIAPLYGGWSALTLLGHVLGLEDPSDHAIARDTLRSFANEANRGAGRFDRWRRERLHVGVVPGTAYAPAGVPRPDWKAVAAALEAPGHAAGFELAFAPCPKVLDGRYANNVWLQELPDPVTKITWENVALLAPADAKRLGIESEQIVEIRTPQGSIKAPAWIMPGHAEGVVTLTLGYGRQAGGSHATGRGYNAYALRTRTRPGFRADAEIKGTGERTQIACVQDSHDVSVNRGSGEMHDRPIVREVALAKLFEEGFEPGKDMLPEEAELPVDPETGEPVGTLWKEPDYSKGQQWGMAIDLNACNGCNACLVACQSENNVPVVGKREVINGREMHWLRIDRYFVGSPDDPEMVQQPMPCQQCEMAPCEQVCPVQATAHSPDGLNDMVYNRCIGTRYCSNNCPFKVRRFNYFNFAKRMYSTDPLPLANNPDVTVRFRGVMEKCTYCVQRIRRAQQDAKNAGRERVEDGAFTTACAQACPADAIVFGDVNDPDSRVSKIKQWRRSYVLFPEMNLQPRTSYLARVRNPNPELV